MLPLILPIGFRAPPVIAGAGHRYWQVDMPSYVSGVVALSTLELYTTYGGADILNAAVAAGATVTASSTYPGFNVNAVYDANANTDWAANPTAVITIDFLAPSAGWKDIVGVGHRGRHDIPSQVPDQINLKYSDDGSAYTTRFSRPAISRRDLVLCKLWDSSLYPAVTAGYKKRWGIRVNTADTSLFHLHHAELRDTISGANRCTAANGTADARWQFNTGYDPNAGWAIVGSDFASLTIPSTLWFEHTDGAPALKPAEIMIRHSTGFTFRGPRTFDLVYEDYNGSGAIGVQQSFTTPTWPTAGETRTFVVT